MDSVGQPLPSLFRLRNEYENTHEIAISDGSEMRLVSAVVTWMLFFPAPLVPGGAHASAAHTAFFIPVTDGRPDLEAFRLLSGDSEHQIHLQNVVMTHHASCRALARIRKRGFNSSVLRQATMYIAGLHLSMPSPQGVEGLAVLTTVDSFRYLLWNLNVPKATSDEQGGIPVPDFASRSLSNKLVFPVQSLAALLPPAVYCTAILFNNLQQPTWMEKFALPDDIIPLEWKTPARLAACAAGFSLKFVLNRILDHSDERWRMIGRCGKPKATRIGPYTIVRHPAYSVMLLQQAFYSVMYWSYIPLASLGVLAGVFAIKIPLEERAAQEDDVIGNDYTEYMKRTPARVIPCVW